MLSGKSDSFHELLKFIVYIIMYSYSFTFFFSFKVRAWGRVVFYRGDEFGMVVNGKVLGNECVMWLSAVLHMTKHNTKNNNMKHIRILGTKKKKNFQRNISMCFHDSRSIFSILGIMHLETYIILSHCRKLKNKYKFKCSLLPLLNKMV